MGNVILKLTEGVAKSLLGMLKDVFMPSVVTKLCYLGVKGGLRTIKHKMDSEEVGGAPLLGTARPVIKAHGSSKAKGIKNRHPAGAPLRGGRPVRHHGGRAGRNCRQTKPGQKRASDMKFRKPRPS